MDAECFKQLFLPCRAKLYRMALRLMDNREDAEDMLQEAYLRLWNKRAGLVGIDNAEAYAMEVLKHCCYDALRSRCHLPSEEGLLQEALACRADDSPARQTEKHDETQQIKRLINTLPRQQRQVMWLRDVNECSFEEIEERTGLNAVNIRVALSRARKKIREQFNRIMNQ